jgi:hypothetical protein
MEHTVEYEIALFEGMATSPIDESSILRVLWQGLAQPIVLHFESGVHAPAVATSFIDVGQVAMTTTKQVSGEVAQANDDE